MKPFEVLGNWPHVDEEPPLTISLPILFRDGEGNWNTRAPGYVSGTTSWHRDTHMGQRIDNRPQAPALLLWANTDPTQVLLPGGGIVHGDDNDVVLLDNRVVQHRTPFSAERNYQRWFRRILLGEEPSDEQIEAWKEQLRCKNTTPVT